MALTITEALAEIKTIGKRLEKKRAFYRQYLARQDGLKDPLATDGGSIAVLEREWQAIADLETRIVTLRTGIARANDATDLTVGSTMTIAQWLTWRRDVAPKSKEFLAAIQSGMNAIREQARKGGLTFVAPGGSSSSPNDIIVNVSETELAERIEEMETILGELDGALSLKNATTTIKE